MLTEVRWDSSANGGAARGIAADLQDARINRATHREMLARINRSVYAAGMMTEPELRKQVLLRAGEMGSQKALAAKIGVSEQVLSLFLAGSRRPSRWLLRALGYEKVVGYRKGETFSRERIVSKQALTYLP